MSVVVYDSTNREAGRKNQAKPGQTVPFSLPPGAYVIRLIGADDVEITALSKRLKAETDEALEI